MYEADWCPACQALKEPLKKIADQLEVVVIHINVDDYSENNNIGYYLPFIPILSVYKDGKLFYHGPAQDPNLIFFPFIKSEE
jgi:thiol-disulfide isomerase/thioredoxin